MKTSSKIIFQKICHCHRCLIKVPVVAVVTVVPELISCRLTLNSQVGLTVLDGVTDQLSYFFYSVLHTQVQ